MLPGTLPCGARTFLGTLADDATVWPTPSRIIRLAKETGARPQRVGEIIAGKRAVTADTDLLPCRSFVQSEGWWLRLQADYDTETAKRCMSKVLAKITPLQRRDPTAK